MLRAYLVNKANVGRNGIDEAHPLVWLPTLKSSPKTIGIWLSRGPAKIIASQKLMLCISSPGCCIEGNKTGYGVVRSQSPHEFVRQALDRQSAEMIGAVPSEAIWECTDRFQLYGLPITYNRNTPPSLPPDTT